MAAFGALENFAATPVRVRLLDANQPLDLYGERFCSCPNPDACVTILAPSTVWSYSQFKCSFEVPPMSGGERIERRLAAILAADVVGYSRLIGTDERGTLSRLKVIRAEVTDSKIAEHHGRIVKTTGDGLLAEFASVVDALACATEIQVDLAERNTSLPTDRRIEFRIGIHQGDIVVEDGDIFGDGVNIAARLEALAEAGGICVSARVREDAAGKLELAFRDLGEQRLKNIERPVRAYAVGDTAPPMRHSSRRIVTSRPVAAAIILAVAVIGTTAWLAWPRLRPPATTAQAGPTTNPPSASEAKSMPRLSIVVLPFADLSEDRSQQYFADGITEDLTTDLSNITGMFVISGNTAFTYKGKTIDAKQVGSELGVRYVLEGSVRRAGTHIRVNVQLIGAETDAHVWAELFDREIGDLLTLQNEVTARIANALGVELTRAEAARPTNNPDALDYLFRAAAVLFGNMSREKYEEAITLVEQAQKLDPLSVRVQSRLAELLINRALDEATDSPNDDLARAEKLLEQAEASATTSSAALHYAKGQLLRAKGQCNEAIREYEKVLAINRNSFGATSHIGRCLTRLGHLEEAIQAQKNAIRLSPKDPALFISYYRLGEAHLLLSHVDEAISWLEKAVSENPGVGYTHIWLASAYGLNGNTKRAKEELARARDLMVNGAEITIARRRLVYPGATAEMAALYEQTYLAGLRKAGVPEE